MELRSWVLVGFVGFHVEDMFFWIVFGFDSATTFALDFDLHTNEKFKAFGTPLYDFD